MTSPYDDDECVAAFVLGKRIKEKKKEPCKCPCTLTSEAKCKMCGVSWKAYFK